MQQVSRGILVRPRQPPAGVSENYNYLFDTKARSLFIHLSTLPSGESLVLGTCHEVLGAADYLSITQQSLLRCLTLLSRVSRLVLMQTRSSTKS
jgi:hypothetical protein